MRKQRSFTRRSGSNGELRTPTTPSTGTFATNVSGGGRGDGGFGGIDFVNFTPSDKNVLMTGVAPSGSSKTKARREKEAMEKSRRISELAFRAVQDAGGDVKLLGDFVI
jgi:hypothetical protein